MYIVCIMLDIRKYKICPHTLLTASAEKYPAATGRTTIVLLTGLFAAAILADIKTAAAAEDGGSWQDLSLAVVG